MKKPTPKHVTFYRTEGKYNWANSNEVSAQYIFNFPHLTLEKIKEIGLQQTFLINIDKDYEFLPEEYTALELTYELKSIIDGYFIHSDKPRIQKMVDYLEGIEAEQEKLRHEYAIENAKYQIRYWQQELESLLN